MSKPRNVYAVVLVLLRETSGHPEGTRVARLGLNGDGTLKVAVCKDGGGWSSETFVVNEADTRRW